MVSDLRTLANLVFSPKHRDSEQWLNAFYKDQAANYDRFRKKLLSGREDMIRGIPVPPKGTWVDLGGGTGANLEWIENISSLEKIVLVDLCLPLLEVARRRVKERGWNNVEVVKNDAARLTLPDRSADVVTLSYSLSMMPNWIAVLDRVRRLLKPGGTIGVVDFYISRKHATGQQHNWLERHFWPAWFERDNVFLSPAHLDTLRNTFQTDVLIEDKGPVPYLPGLKVPYYIFQGTKEAG